MNSSVTLRNRHSVWLAEQAVVAACAWATFFALYTEGFEAEWYGLDRVMSFTEGPPFQHRLLVAYLAKAIQSLTGWGTPRCFLLSQIPVILLLFQMSLVWSRLFVERRLVIAGPVLLCVMIVPTFHYWTFYDLAIALFFMVGLWATFRRAWLLFVVTVALGTLNHEGILLLIPTAAVVWWRRTSNVEWLRPTGVALVIHMAIRSALFMALPTTVAWASGKVAFNLQLPFRNPDALAMAMLTLLPWWGLCALAWDQAQVTVRRAAVLLPLQFIVVFLVGQFNEPRHFIPFMPVAVAFVLGWLGQRDSVV